MPKFLNEELERMKGLMVFDYEKNSHDILSEQNINKSLIKEQEEEIKHGEVEGGEGEPNYEWIQTQMKATTGVEDLSGCFDVGGEGHDRIQGLFDVTVTTGSDAVKNFVASLKNEIESHPKAKNYLGKRGNFNIESMDIIAGASNGLEGSVTPNMNNDYQPQDYNDEDYDHKVGSSTYSKNMGYAQGRGDNVKVELIKSLPKNGISIDSDNISVTPYIIDTGGVTDDEDGHLTNPGQVALVKMRVCWVDAEETVTPGLIEEFLRCMGNVSVQVNYEGKPTHSCNAATFKIFANGEQLTRSKFGLKDGALKNSESEFADLNNGSGDGKVLGRKNGNQAGNRYNEFELSSGELMKILSVEKLREFKGKLQIEAECVKPKTVRNKAQWDDDRKYVYTYEDNEGNVKEFPYSFIATRKEKAKRYFNYTNSGDPKLYEMGLYLKYIVNLPSFEKYGKRKEDMIKYVKKNIRSRKGIITRIKNEYLGREGCHKGVATIHVLQNGKPVDFALVSTPKWVDGNEHKLGEPLEACNSQWVKVVNASKLIPR